MKINLGVLYLVNYCHRSCVPLKNIMWLPREQAFALARKMAEQNKDATAFYRFADFDNYYRERLKTDELLYARFCELGGRPAKKHPLSFVLQGSEFLDNWFDKGIVTRIPLEYISADQISFTYGDSMSVLRKQGGFTMLTKEMLMEAMADYDGTLEGFLLDVNRRYHYMEVQVWQEVDYTDVTGRYKTA